MKEPCCLAASTAVEPSPTLINLYAKRSEIERRFRDTKDLPFLMSLRSLLVSTPDTRDLLSLIYAFAVVSLSLLLLALVQLRYDPHL